VQTLAGATVAEGRVYGVDDLLGSVGYSALLGGAAAFTCRGPALDQQGFDARLFQAMGFVEELELGKAGPALRALRDDLPCSVAVVAPRQLHDIFFFGGLAAAYEGDKDGAVDQFARAVAIKGDVPLPTDFPPDVQQLYLLGKDRSLSAQAALLSVLPPAGSRQVWIDGTMQSGAGALELTLRPGTHFVHVETAQGTQRAIGLDLGEGACLWADPRAAGVAVEEGQGAGPAGRAADALLAQAAAEWQADAIYVASARGVFAWHEGGGGLARAARPLQPPGARLGMRIGGGVLVREAPYRPAPFTYAAPSLDLELALIRGLEIGLDATVGIASFVDGRTSVLPSLSLGPQWAWPGARLRPVFGVHGAMTVDGPGSVRWGGLARLGVRFRPTERARLRLAVGAAFGWVGAVQAGISVTVGAGLGGPNG
jgi:hypothetical protein